MITSPFPQRVIVATNNKSSTFFLEFYLLVQLAGLIRLLCYFLDNSCRNAPDNNICRNIFSHHRSGCDDRIVAAYILAKYYRGG